MSSDVELETHVVRNIQSGIDQGRILQDQKSLFLKGKHAGLIKQPRLAKEEMRGRSKSKDNKRASNSPIVKTTRSSAAKGHGSSHKSRVAKKVFLYNSMRICELAAPSKRQCLESWRANSNILPAIMIHRLQQRIMDKEPVVKVADVTYSKHNKRPKKHTQEKVMVIENRRPTSSRENREARYRTSKARRQDNQEYIAMFEKKIAELLMRPMQISLNSELQKVNSIVSHELYNIIRQKRVFRTNNVTKPMVSEISEKVTIWIAKILEDSAEKLLLEDLKDLEEKEGPVLDILEDILDIILRKCIRTPSITPEFVSASSGDIDNIDDDEGASKTGSKGDVEDTIEEDITKQINQLVDSLQHDDFIDETITLVDDELNGSTQDDNNLKNIDDDDISKQIDKITDSSNPEDILDMSPEFYTDPSAAESHDVHLIYNNKAFEDESKPEDQNSSDTRDLNESEPTEDQVAEDNAEISTTHDQDMDDTNLTDEIPLSDKTSVNSNIENPIDTNEEQTSNVSAAIEVVTEELSEEKDAKVKLKLKESIDVIPTKENELDLINRDIQQSFDVHITGKLNEPNGYLLYEADESWPADATTAKPSATILTTALSMGQILEADEKYSISLDEPTELLTQYTEKSHPKNTEDKNGLSPQNTENIDEGSDSKNDEHQLQAKVKTRETSTGMSVISSQNTEESLENGDKDKHNIGNTEKALDKAFKNKVGDTKPDSIKNVQRTDEISGEVDNGSSTQNVKRNDAYGDGEKIEHSSQNSGNSMHKKNNYDLSHKAKKGSKEQDLEYISKHINQQTNDYNSVAGLSTDPVQQDAIQIANTTVRDSGINVKTKDYQPKMGQMQKDINEDDQKKLVLAEKTPRKKFDYRVDKKTAPSWIRVGQGEPSGGPCACRPAHYPVTNRMIELQKWYQNLDYTVDNIHKWNHMLNFISKYITTLKQKTEKEGVIAQNKWPTNKRDDTRRGSNKRANKHFELRRRDDAVKLKICSSPVRSCGRCGKLKS